MNRGQNSVSYTPLIVAGSLVLFLWIASWLALTHAIDAADERGQFGDMFGAINALFSGLAFAGIIYTILLQRKELALQREELAATREELRRTAIAQEESKKALEQQVANQLRAARIHGLSTLVEHFTIRLNEADPRGHTRSQPEYGQHMASRDQFLKDLIREVEDSFMETRPESELNR